MVTKIVTSKQIFDYINAFLRICGCHPEQKSFLIKTWTLVTPALNTFLATFVLLKLINEKGGIVVAVNDMTNFLIISHVIVKSICMHLNKSKLAELLETINEKFWFSNEIPEEKNKYDNLHKTILTVMRSYGVIMLLAFVFAIFTPWILAGYELIFEMWFFGLEDKLHETPYYEIMYVCQCLTLTLNVLFVIPFDNMFMAMVGIARVQLEMLRYKLLRICETNDEEKAFEELKKAVKHHNIILKFLSDVESYFSISVLKQYTDSITLIGLYIYLIQQEFRFYYFFCLMTNISQAFLFSLYGQIIQDESNEVAEAAFGSGWENLKSHKLKQGLAIVIATAHRKVELTAGGIIVLSFETYLRVLKAAFSFLTFLRSTK